MWYVCGCNLGCSKIAVPRAGLRDGLRVQVVSGTEKGTTGFVFEHKDQSGARVFGLSPNDGKGIQVCDLPSPKDLGYVCETSKSGDPDAHKCDTACD